MDSVGSLLFFVFFFGIPIFGIISKLVPSKIHGVRLQETDTGHAWFLVAQYAEGTFETNFGYPSGFFVLHDKKTIEGQRVLALEAQPAGTLTDGCAAGILGEGTQQGCLGFFVAYLIALPFIAISIADRFYRWVLRSRVNVTVRAEGQDSILDLSFYGIGGYMLRNRYAAVFTEPALPVDIFPPEALPTDARTAA